MHWLSVDDNVDDNFDDKVDDNVYDNVGDNEADVVAWPGQGGGGKDQPR